MLELLAWAVSQAAVAVITAVVSDGRYNPSPRRNRFAVRDSPWKTVDAESERYNGWFKRFLRVNHKSFNAIVEIIEGGWVAVHGRKPARNARYKIRDMVAVTLNYLSEPKSYAQAGALFGMGKTTTFNSVHKVVEVIVSKVGPQFMPELRIAQEWQEISNGFYEIKGFPDVVGAIDGTLIRIEKPSDYEGFYNRKRFASFNVQAVCDSKKKFLSFEIFPKFLSFEIFPIVNPNRVKSL